MTKTNISSVLPHITVDKSNEDAPSKVVIQPLPETFEWLAELAPAQIAEFFVELMAAIHEATISDDWEMVTKVIETWQEAADLSRDSETAVAEVRVGYQVNDVVSIDKVPAKGIPDAVMVEIEAAAGRNNHRAFAKSVEKIEWESRPVENFIQVIGWAISLHHISLARELIEKGCLQFPANEALAQAKRVLAPAVVLGFKPAKPGLVHTMNWMEKHAAEYQGQWIAAGPGKLLAAAPSLRELIEAVGGLEALPEDAIVDKIV